MKIIIKPNMAIWKIKIMPKLKNSNAINTPKNG